MISKVFIRFKNGKISIVMDGNVLKANQIPFPAITFTGPIKKEESFDTHLYFFFFLSDEEYTEFYDTFK
jgi:hypothetical protein